MHLDLFMPNSKRFSRSLILYGPIDVDESKYTIMGTKVLFSSHINRLTPLFLLKNYYAGRISVKKER